MVFDDKSEEVQQEKDEQRKKEWETKLEAEKKAREQLKGKNNMLFYAGVAGAIVVVLVGGYFAMGFLSQSPTGAATSTVVNTAPPEGVKFGDTIHWHPELMISVCGKPYSLPPETGDMPGIHTHSDMPRIHLETTYDPAKTTLGSAMRALMVRFDKGVLFDKKDGDKCPDGKAGKVVVKSDGQLVDDYLNLPLRDGQKVEVSFG